MRYIIVIFCALCAVIPTNGQSLNFNHTTYDFGVIDEMGGVVSHTFKFRNGGDAPLVIYNTRSTCGCTSANYSSEPIMAGDSSEIVVSYDPINRPGSFMRDVYIYSTAEGSPTVIRVTGSVDARTLTLEQKYPYSVGDVARVSATHLSVGAIKRGILTSARLQIVNVSADDFKVELRPRRANSYLDVGFAKVLEPREGASMEIGYLIESGERVDLGEDGRIADTLDIFIDGENSNKWLRVSGILSK